MLGKHLAMQHGSWFHESNIYWNRCRCKKWSRKPWHIPFNSLIRKHSVPDPDLGGGGGVGAVIQTLIQVGGGRGGLPKFCFRPLGPQFGLKIRGAPPRASPLDPPLTFRYDSVTTHSSLEGALYLPTEAPMMSGRCISTLDPVFFLYSLPL